MIFVTVGTDGPFDRLVRAVEEWAVRNGRPDVVAQIGRSALKSRHIDMVEFLDPREFRARFMQASVIVSHAGMGTILTALHYRKPLIVMPRRAALGEQRNDHQVATARHLRELHGITVAMNEAELAERLSRLDDLTPHEAIGAYAQPELLNAIGEFIHGRGASR